MSYQLDDPGTVLLSVNYGIALHCFGANCAQTVPKLFVELAAGVHHIILAYDVVPVKDGPQQASRAFRQRQAQIDKDSNERRLCSPIHCILQNDILMCWRHPLNLPNLGLLD